MPPADNNVLLMRLISLEEQHKALQKEIEEIRHTVFGNGRPGLKERMDVLITEIEANKRMFRSLAGGIWGTFAIVLGEIIIRVVLK